MQAGPLAGLDTAFGPKRGPNATEQAFDALHDAIVSLELPPGTRVSEAEVARQLGVSRQPVRDAFFRLSQLGFLQIRPQRATTISRISQTGVRRAQFIRAALEEACLRSAMARITPPDLAGLEAMLADQAAAATEGRRLDFHALDDAFHRRICEIAGHGYVWSLIRDHKAHMDRVRYLSLSFGTQSAFDDHAALLEAMRAGDLPAALDRLRAHLGRIEQLLPRVHADHATYFEEPPAT